MDKKTLMENYKNKINYKLYIAVIIFYLFLLIWVIALKYNNEFVEERRLIALAMPLSIRGEVRYVPEGMTVYKWVPFFYSAHAVSRDVALSLLKDYALNVLIYVPMGAYLFVLLDSKLKVKLNLVITFAIALISSIIFELVQLFTGLGYYDGTDIVMNSLGGIIGWLIALLIKKCTKTKFPLAVNIILSVCAILFAPIVIYAFVNTVIHADLYVL